MARQGITFEQVAAIADAMVAEGQQPTIRAVRERLGTGSPNTIHKHLAAWRAARPAPTASAPELPQGLIAAIAAEIERAAAKARAEIEAQLAQARAEADELAEAGEKLEAERDGLARQVAELTRERDTLAGIAQQRAADLEEAQKRIEGERQAAEAARVEVATARVKIEQLAERLKEQAAEIQRLRDALAEAQQGRTTAEQRAAVLEARLEAAEARASRAEARIEQLEKEAAEAREQAARLTAKLEALEGDRRENPPRSQPYGDLPQLTPRPYRPSQRLTGAFRKGGYLPGGRAGGPLSGLSEAQSLPSPRD